MSRPIGLPKTGGRKKGTPNRRSTQLEERLCGLGLDVPGRLVEILPTLDPAHQAQVLLGLLTFIYPKRKAVDQTVEVELPSSDRLSALSDEELFARYEQQRQHVANLLGVKVP
jgi:hypothetical protein